MEAVRSRAWICAFSAQQRTTAASRKSLRPREEGQRDEGKDASKPSGSRSPGGRNPSVSFHGQRRSNEVSVSGTDPEARLTRIKGKEAKLSYRGHLVVENRHGLIVSCAATPATGRAEEETALLLLSKERERTDRPMTVGADRGYNTKAFVRGVREMGITPHMARKKRYKAIDGRATTWEGYRTSQRRSKIVEEPFGWMKTVGNLGKLRHRGMEKVRSVFTFASAAYNLVRMGNLGVEACPV